MSIMAYLARTLLGAAFGQVSVLQAAKAQSILLHEFLFFSNKFHSEGSTFGQDVAVPVTQETGQRLIVLSV